MWCTEVPPCSPEHPAATQQLPPVCWADGLVQHAVCSMLSASPQPLSSPSPTEPYSQHRHGVEQGNAGTTYLSCQPAKHHP